MAEAKHTPGPWECGGVGSDGSFEIWGRRDEPRDEFVICSRNPITHRAKASRANARLIAAAPDLLVALRSCPCPRPINTDPDSTTIGQCFDAGHCGCDLGAALAKVNGKGERMSWSWNSGTPKERADTVRQHVRACRNSVPALCDLFHLTPQGCEAILRGADWRPEYTDA